MSEQGGPNQEPAAQYDYDSLSERQCRGLELWRRAQSQNGLVLLVSDDSTLWFSQNDTTRAYRVERETRNRRGVLQTEYRCQCQDFVKQGAIDCKHIFADKLRRQEIRINTFPSVGTRMATRRQPRKSLTFDGRTTRSAFRSAKRKLPERIPELGLSLKRAFERSGAAS